MYKIATWNVERPKELRKQLLLWRKSKRLMQIF